MGNNTASVELGLYLVGNNTALVELGLHLEGLLEAFL